MPPCLTDEDHRRCHVDRNTVVRRENVNVLHAWIVQSLKFYTFSGAGWSSSTSFRVHQQDTTLVGFKLPSGRSTVEHLLPRLTDQDRHGTQYRLTE